MITTFLTDKDAVIKYDIQSLTNKQKAQARENIGAIDAATLESLLGNSTSTLTSINLYDPSLQTSETISPHYWFNGGPYETTQFDSTWHCTAPIPVEPNTLYTVGLVPSIVYNETEYIKPWGGASAGVFFFDTNNVYISRTSDNVFTTPANATYIRMNYFISASVVSLDKLNAHCMLVKGNTLPDKYSAYGSSPSINFPQNLYAPPIQYHIDNNVLKVASHYFPDKDFLVTMNLGRGNGLFDFDSFKLIPSDMNIADSEGSAVQLIKNGTDWHAPFIVKAINNIDGDDVDSAYFTGGNHQYNNQGSGSTKTARSVSLRFFVDGREVTSEKGYAHTIEVRWINNIQGYNTKKADGSGREILQERHRLIFNGVEWNETIELEPLETIRIDRWYGLQFSYSSVWPNYYYIGATNRTLYTKAASDCGGKNADGIVAFSNEHKIEMTIDTSIDLGKRAMTGSIGALCSTGKAYMFIIDWKQMEPGEIYRLCGSYKFMPA